MANSKRSAARRRAAIPPSQIHFVVWDGEGRTYPDDLEQSYILFGNSEGDLIQGKKLTTRQCFELMLRAEEQHPDAVHVGFAFTYDVNMILAGLPRREMLTLYKNGKVRWEEYRIEWIKKKWFQVSIPKIGLTCTIYDVFSFFQTSFVKATEDWIGESLELERIREGKAMRGQFETVADQYVIDYWTDEIRLMKELVESLRDSLVSADMVPKRWYGPGAVANVVLRRNKGKGHMSRNLPDKVVLASQHAFAGGRFEHYKRGYHTGPIYGYDINSAYPAAIAQLPSLGGKEWHFDAIHPQDTTHPRLINPLPKYGVWHVLFNNEAPYDQAMETGKMDSQPFHYRDPDYRIYFPPQHRGWYWTPEVEAARARFGNDIAHVERGWWVEDDGQRPFEWVEDMYYQRLELKKAGDPAQRALKLALNSIYGKTAQRVGWDREKKMPPSWHQLEWAGMITSHTRAKLWAETLCDNPDVIACETDGVYSLKPIPGLKLGSGLGEWTLTMYDAILYLQNGVYWALQQDGEWVGKNRGFDVDSLTLESAMKQLENINPNRQPGEPGGVLTGQTTRFQGFHPLQKRWRQWTTDERQIKLDSLAKRVHVPAWCQACKDGASYLDALHDMIIPVHLITEMRPESIEQHGLPLSLKHPLPWIDGENVSPWPLMVATDEQLLGTGLI